MPLDHRGLKPLSIPLHRYIILVFFSFLSSILFNIAYEYVPSIPFQVVVRSSSLASSLLLGMVVLHRRFAPLSFANALTQLP